MENIKVRIDGGNASLLTEVWEFAFWEREGALVLSRYHMEKRESVRHKWRTSGWYDRTNARDSTIKEEDVPLPDNVKGAAVKQFMFKLRIGKKKEILHDG